MPDSIEIVIDCGGSSFASREVKNPNNIVVTLSAKAAIPTRLNISGRSSFSDRIAAISTKTKKIPDIIFTGLPILLAKFSVRDRIDIPIETGITVMTKI